MLKTIYHKKILPLFIKILYFYAKLQEMLKAAVVGAGHLGKIHLKLLQESTQYELIGFHDVDIESSKRLAEETGYTFFENIEDLLPKIDVLDIVTPTAYHFPYALQAIDAGKHIFIEKPIAQNLKEADEILKRSKEKGVLGQVGHVERFNPAFTAALPYIENPMFLEIHRLAEFNPRGTDVAVVLDLMIHDIDIVLSMVKSPIKSIKSNGVSVVSQNPDIANARLEFENGCVANVTTSRISMKNMRKSRVFQRDAYISIDFLEKKTEIIRMKDAPKEISDFDMIIQNAEGENKQILFEYPEVNPNNAILDELNSFADSINNNSKVRVSLQEGREALKVALDVLKELEK